MLNSGNTDIDALTYGQGLANQAYGGWQSNLQGLINPQLSALTSAAGGQATADTNMANAYGTNAAANTALQGTVASGLAGTNTNLANNQVNLGNSLSGLYCGDAANQVALQGGMTSGNMAANNTQAAGEAAGAKNLLGAGLSLAGDGGGRPDRGALGGGLSSLFGGGSSGATAPACRETRWAGRRCPIRHLAVSQFPQPAVPVGRTWQPPSSRSRSRNTARRRRARSTSRRWRNC